MADFKLFVELTSGLAIWSQRELEDFEDEIRRANAAHYPFVELDGHRLNYNEIRRFDAPPVELNA